MINYLKKLILDWKTISLISKTKFVQNILIWIVIVPIVSKIFEKVDDKINLNFNNVIFEFNFSLPFSLSLFYFSAVFFLIGNILYKLSVPKVIDENKSFSSFIEEGKSKLHLSKYLEEENINISNDCSSLYSDSVMEKDEVSDIFWEIWDISNIKKKYFRFFISLFYILAIMLIIIVFIQNICYVLLSMDIIKDLSDSNSFVELLNYVAS